MLAAPAGYGKSTLLAAWRASDETETPVAWLTVDEHDNDPAVLWSYVLEALRRACPELETPACPQRVRRAGDIELFLTELVNALCDVGEVALVLDDFHALSKGPARESVGWFVEHAPASFRLIVAARHDPVLPLPALRAHGQLVELRAADLGFNAAETDVLLNDRLELGLEPEQIEDLVVRTEGWPAGLYLAALSLKRADDRHQAVFGFSAQNRDIVDFLLDEVLDAHDPAMQDLMLRCSVLERLSGRLCDDVLERAGSSHVLDELSRANLFLIPLDDRGEWYRFHHVFGQLLRVELEHREPGVAATLHRRAYAWHRDHGSTEQAIEHALEAGAFAEAGELIIANWIYYANAWKQATVLRWLERFPARVMESSAALLAVKAWILSMCAMREEALQAMARVERLDGLDQGPLPDGASSPQASMATLRATLPFGDVGVGYENAIRAAELERPESPFWPLVCWARGMGHFFRGEFVEAEPWFAQAAGLAPSAGMWLIAGSALAYQSFIAGEDGDVERQEWFAEQAAQLARKRGAEHVDGEVPLALGASLAARGKLDEARPLFDESVEVLRGNGQPIDLAHALIRQAAVLSALGEADAAAAAVAEARATIDCCPDPGILEEWVSALERSPRKRSGKENGELSERELAVLRALTGPLSERDIARELYLSHNTVHSHTRSIYRKLGASSRAEAIRRARELGLL
ncbi:MAG TPA: LuxR C-terminal-related transcriptional regulator [Gaiellaceae bacterium]|nr:LuxR C-terminal-related transcriptional regulator [Gaiellaceae bacterium]